MNISSELKFLFFDEESERIETTVDFIVFVAILSITTGFGIFYGCFRIPKDTSEEIHFGKRQMKVIPTSMSLVASFTSAATLLGVPSTVYFEGIIGIWTMVAYLLCTVITAHVFIPIYHGLKLSSSYEYLEYRFNKRVKLLASCLFIVQMIFYIGILCYTPMRALSMNMTLYIVDSDWISITVLVLICIVYTTFGGMRAIMWTDSFQYFVMVAGIFGCIVKGLIDFDGGFQKIISLNSKHDRFDIFDFSIDPTDTHTVFSNSIGEFIQWLSIYAVNQVQVQRYLSMPSARDAKWAIYLACLNYCFIDGICLVLGMVIFAYYYKCDILKSGKIDYTEQILPQFTMEFLRNQAGLQGLFLACLFSGVLSSVSSGLNSISTVFLECIIKGYLKKDISDKNATRVSKLICLVSGLICLSLTLISKVINIGSFQDILALLGITGSPVLGLFLLGYLFPFTNSTGAISGTVVSIVCLLWLFLGRFFSHRKIPHKTKPFANSYCNFTNNSELVSWTNVTENISSNDLSFMSKFYSISYCWYALIGVIIVLIAGCIVSLLTKSESKNIDPKYVSPIFDRTKKLLAKILFRCRSKRAYQVEPVTEKAQVELGNIEMNFENEN